MVKIKAWISASRLRTLPLSVSGIIVGTALAAADGYQDRFIFFLALITTISFQVLSNFANDYGDGVKGTDNKDRIGPARAIQSGRLSISEMKRGIVITALFAFVVAIILLYRAFGTSNLGYFIFFFLLGLASIAAAIKYTVGKTAYGYVGLGDVFVFVFFGFVSVLGSYFLYAQHIEYHSIWLALTIGLLSVAVLNLNNMRDRKNDLQADKRTLVVKMGPLRAKYYHFFLVITAVLSGIIYTIATHQPLKNFLCLLAFLPLIIHLIKVYKTIDERAFDPELKKVALSTFLFALLFSFSRYFL